MKCWLFLLAVLFGSAANVLGTHPDSSALPDGVQIQSFEFRPVFKEEAQEAFAPPDSTDPRAYEARTRGPGPNSDVYTLEKRTKQERGGFEVHLQLKNSGPRDIRRVDWDFLFLDSESGRELKKFSIDSKSKIRSGEVKFLTKQVLPALFLGDKTKPDYARGRPAVVIRRIEFADGSKWEGALRKL
jgi:hypothetical protein